MAADDPDDELEFDEDEYEGEYEDEDAGDLDAEGDEDVLGDDIDQDELDFDDDFDEKPPVSKKKKIILIGAGSFFGLLLIALGAIIFLGHGGVDEETATEALRPAGALAIPPKNRMKTGRELRRADSNKLRPRAGGNAALRPPKTSSAGPVGTPGSKPKLTRAPDGPATSTGSRDSQNDTQSDGENASESDTAPHPATARRRTNLASAAPPTTQVIGARIVPGAGLTVPSVTADSYRAISMQPKSEALAAPNQDLMETIEGRVVPKVGGQGEKAWQTYARPFKVSPQKARISLVIRGLGLSRNTTLAAINQLPASVSLVFSPYTRGLEQWAGLARGAGHETLLSLPMEPVDFPSSDPGPLALMTDLKGEENIARLNQIMDLSQAFVGFVQNMGSRFAKSEAALQPVLEYVRDRGLMYVDDGKVKGGLGTELANSLLLPNARGDMIIDDDASGSQIAANLRELERIAKEKQVAVGIGEALPATVLQISRWVGTLPGKNIDLAPITGVANVPAPPPPPETQSQ